MKLIHALVLAGPLFVGTVRPVSSAQDPSARDRAAVREDWIVKDLERVDQVRAFFDTGPFTVEAFLRATKSFDVREDRAIGFGARRLHLALYGGHTTIWVKIFAQEKGDDGSSAIARLDIVQQGYRDSWENVSARLAPAWGEGVERVELGLRRERVDKDLDAALRLRIARALGGPVDASPSKELAAPLDILVDPLALHIVGLAEGDDGAPPLALASMKSLVDAGRFDLVRAVLRGPNPEARVYAAHALETHGQREEADIAAVEVLAKLPLQLEVRVGCTGLRAAWSEAIEFLDDD